MVEKVYNPSRGSLAAALFQLWGVLAHDHLGGVVAPPLLHELDDLLGGLVVGVDGIAWQDALVHVLQLRQEAD